jgi:hypothetical protein
MLTLVQTPANDNPTKIHPERDYERLLMEAKVALERAAEAKLAKVGKVASFAEREVALLDVSNETCRLSIEAHLQSLADQEAEELLVDGVLYRRHKDGTGRYHSLCGSLGVGRATYRKVGERNGPTIVPLELQAGLVEGATPALAYRVALGYAQDPGRQVAEQIRASHRDPPSRSTLERMAKAIGGAAQAKAHRIEPIVRRSEVLPEETVGISVGLDRTTVPMEQEREAGSPPKTRRKTRTKPYVRAVPPPVDVNYKMAYVGTVSVVDDDGESLQTRRYAAPAEAGPGDILARMMADVIRAREQNPRLAVGLMQDGAPEMWRLTRDALKSAAGVNRWREGIDRYHLNERFGEILRIVEPDASERSKLLSQWNANLDVDDGAIDCIEGWLLDKINACCNDDDRNKLVDHWVFIDNNSDRMRYATLRRLGLPCGSGATEGACKSLVMIRAKRCGQRWHDDGINAVLTLRGIYMSERLPAFWDHFSNDYTAEVKSAA